MARGQDVNEASGRGFGNFTGLMRAVADSNNDSCWSSPMWI